MCPLTNTLPFLVVKNIQINIVEWADNPTRLRIFNPDTGTHPQEQCQISLLGSLRPNFSRTLIISVKNNVALCPHSSLILF